MTDQRHALFARIVGDRLQVEIGGRLGEAEVVAMAEPIAVPALVPPLDEHAAEAVLRREVDILFGPRGRRAVVRPLGPAPRPADHSPPDAAIFHRLEPTDVAELVRSEERRVGKEWVSTVRSRG